MNLARVAQSFRVNRHVVSMA